MLSFPFPILKPPAFSRQLLAFSVSVPKRLQRLLRVQPVIEWHDGVLEFLVSLVAFARNEHCISGLRLADDLLDGPAPVQLHAAAFGTHRVVALKNLRRDFYRRFLARIVVRDEREISQLRGDLAHARALACIAISAAAKC